MMGGDRDHNPNFGWRETTLGMDLVPAYGGKLVLVYDQAGNIITIL